MKILDYKIFINTHTTIRKAMKVIQECACGIALIVDESQRLIATITDGDIRRAILNGVDLESDITTIFQYAVRPSFKPITAHFSTSKEVLLMMMKEKSLKHIPLLDNEGRVVELILLSELIKDEFTITAVVMAGGRGERLHPLTTNVPKPMLPLQNGTLVERIIEQLRDVGITKVQISTHYKSEVIKNYFGDGRNRGVDISYIDENQPLGTAGALGLIPMPSSTNLVINGDILTQLDFRAMYDFHKTHNAIMTMGLRKCEFKVPYGVVGTEDIKVTQLVEKPVQSFLVNAGIYLLEPAVFQYIPKNKYFDMTDLIGQLLKNKQHVISFPIQEYWLDVGLHEDYKRAIKDIELGKV